METFRRMIFSSKFILRKNLFLPWDGERKAALECLSLFIGWVGGKRRAPSTGTREDGGGDAGATARRRGRNLLRLAQSTEPPRPRRRPSATRGDGAQPQCRSVAAHIRNVMFVTLYRVGGWAAASIEPQVLGDHRSGRRVRGDRGRNKEDNKESAATPHKQRWAFLLAKMRIGAALRPIACWLRCIPTTETRQKRRWEVKTSGEDAKPLRRVGLPR